MKKPMKSRKSFAAGTILSGALAIGSLQAGAKTITVLNPSFEDNTYPAPALDWTPNNGSHYTVIAQADAAFTGITGNQELSDQVESFSYQQVDTLTLADVGMTFDLTVASPEPTADTIYLTVGGTLATGTVAAANTAGSDANGTHFMDETISFTVLPTQVGDSLYIDLNNPTVNNPYDRSDFDNVRLTETAGAIPEPSTWALILAGFVSLIGFRRLSRKA